MSPKVKNIAGIENNEDSNDEENVTPGVLIDSLIVTFVNLEVSVTVLILLNLLIYLR